MKWPFLLLLVAACDLSGGERADTGKCPELYCSDTTPQGLHFYGDDISEHDWLSDLFTDGPGPTAVGGIQHVRLSGLDGHEFGAGTDGSNGISVIASDASTPSVTIRGVGDGSDYLRIVDPVTATLYDRKRLYGSTIQEIALAPIQWEDLRGSSATTWSFLPSSTIAVALTGDVPDGGHVYRERLVDAGMTIDIPTGITRTAWDAITVPDTVGTSTITVHAGSAAATALDVNVVDAIDTIAAVEVPDHLVLSNVANVCFVGRAAGAPVAGLDWKFLVDGVAGSGVAANCVLWQPAQLGQTTIEARAGGLVVTVHLEVVDGPPPAPRLVPERPRATSAGERALTSNEVSSLSF